MDLFRKKRIITVESIEKGIDGIRNYGHSDPMLPTYLKSLAKDINSLNPSKEQKTAYKSRILEEIEKTGNNSDTYKHCLSDL